MSLRDEILQRFPELHRLIQDGVAGDVFVVGGAIRDLLRGASPLDVDVVCDFPEAAAAQIGGTQVRLGRDSFTALRCVVNARVYDFTALPDGGIEPDLLRRDFTINAIALNLQSGQLLDLTGGRADLERRVVRMIRAENFDDDPLRMLKAVRMAVTLDFDVDPATLSAIRARAHRLSRSAPERVTYELNLILSAGRFRKAVDLLDLMGLREILGLGQIRPERDDVPLAAALAILVTDVQSTSDRWRWSSELTREAGTLQRLVRSHELIDLHEAGEQIARQLPPLLAAIGRHEPVPMPDFAMRAILDGGEIARLLDLDPGPEVGRVKRALLDAQLRGEVTSREEAERFVSASG